ncbi:MULTISPECIES: VOC family protein [unclassified Nocardiopsis]|uniref:VOC family protein n=1 Tax=unclassified Nocardiopsis TaxID=2649073 RepID=UPI0033E6594E
MTVGSLVQWVVNAVDPPALARFWSSLLGGEVEVRPDGWAVLHGASGQPRISFQPTSEPGGGRDRVHPDLLVGDLADASRAAVALGAVAVGEPVTDEHGAFQVLRDPEGNAFCVVKPAH